MDPKALIQLLWIAGMACQTVLVLVLLLRKSWRTFPLFSAYSIFNLFSAAFVYISQTQLRLYFYSYWLAEAIGIGLGFAVLYEIFGHLFSAHPALRKIATLAFNSALLLFICMGVIVLVKHSPVGFRGISSAVLVMEEAARTIEVGVLISLFLLSTAFGLHWRQQVFGVALGLGIFAAVELIAVTMRAETGTTADSLLTVVRIVAFNASLLIWIGYLLAPERSAKSTELPERSQLEQWNQAVMELIRQ